MASIVTITTATETVRCDADGQGVHVFNISNTSGAPIRVGTKILVEGSAQEQWLQIEGASERDLDEKGADQLSVRIKAQKGTAAGRYRFRLLVFSVKNPGEDFSESPTVAFEIPEPKSGTKEPAVVKPPFPWWIPAVVVGVLVVGGLAWWFMSNGEEPRPPVVEKPRPVEADLSGVWQNKDSQTPGNTKLEIRQHGDKVTVHAWGKCHPTDCDWGEETGTLRKNTAFLVWDQGFVVRKMTLTLQGNDLTVVTDSTYRDDRPRRQSREVFARVK